MIRGGERMSSEELASMAGRRVTCICFFGGDPTPQIHHAIEAARIARRRRDGILRVCLETNGNMAPHWLDEIARISWESGGGIKFDLKCHSESLHIALTGVSNRQALENVGRLARLHRERPEVPFIRASTLLVPGYVDEEEVGRIAEYLARIDPTIPYSLLAYSPQFEMGDLPLTTARLAEACKRAAEEAGLERVNIGNAFLLAH
jgi:pyruvate formate lyase activating enzyme